MTPRPSFGSVGWRQTGGQPHPERVGGGLLQPPKEEAARRTGMFYRSGVECREGSSYAEYEKRNLFNPDPPIY